jgi:hypothetical protein
MEEHRWLSTMVFVSTGPASACPARTSCPFEDRDVRDGKGGRLVPGLVLDLLWMDPPRHVRVSWEGGAAELLPWLPRRRRRKQDREGETT